MIRKICKDGEPIRCLIASDISYFYDSVNGILLTISKTKRGFSCYVTVRTNSAETAVALLFAGSIRELAASLSDLKLTFPGVPKPEMSDDEIESTEDLYPVISPAVSGHKLKMFFSPSERTAIKIGDFLRQIEAQSRC